MTDELDSALPPLGDGDLAFGAGAARPEPSAPKDFASRSPGDLDQLYDVPVTVSAILGRARLPVGDLLKIGPGSLLELDRRVGEAVDIRINDRLVARGEVVLVEERLGVTLTEIVLPSA